MSKNECGNYKGKKYILKPHNEVSVSVREPLFEGYIIVCSHFVSPLFGYCFDEDSSKKTHTVRSDDITTT